MCTVLLPPGGNPVAVKYIDINIKIPSCDAMSQTYVIGGFTAISVTYACKHKLYSPVLFYAGSQNGNNFNIITRFQCQCSNMSSFNAISRRNK